MAVASTSASQFEEEKQMEGEKQIKGSEVRVDSDAKTCHQCRQKTKSLMAQCTNLRRGKPCPIKYCLKCLLNRYGEMAEEVALLVDWKCPKCRDICNCSFCMKKKGHRPTGILVHTAKATGFSSVSELLQAKGPENFGYEKIVKDLDASSKKDSTVTSPRKLGKENSFDGDCDSKVGSLNLTSVSGKKSKKMKREGLKELCNGNKDNEASLKKNSPKKPKTSNEALKKSLNGNEKDNGCVSVENNFKTEAEMDDSSGFSKGEETKHGKSKKARVLDGEVPKEISEKRMPKISDEESRKKPKLKEDSKSDFVGEENSERQVVESNNISAVRKKASGVKSEDHGGLDGFQKNNISVELKSSLEPCKDKKFTTQLLDKKCEMDVQLPQGACLATVAGVDLPPEAVGDALQFLEFCAAFGEVFDFKKGQAESVIREIIRGRGRCRVQYSPVVQIHTQLLSLIQKDMGKEFPSLKKSDNSSWFRALGECLSESQCKIGEFPSDFCDNGVDAYYLLDSSTKLKLLNFLCDEALCTTTLRSWIDKQDLEFAEREKEAKENILVARDKVKELRQKMQAEVAKAIIEKNNAPISVSEHENLIVQIKREAAQAQADVLRAVGMLPKKRQRSDAVRTAAVLVDAKGHAFWRLRGYTSEKYILLQDIGTLDPVAIDEKWFAYDVEQKLDVEKYFSSIRTKRLRIRNTSASLPVASVETSL